MNLLEDAGFQQTTFQLHGVACQKHQRVPCRLVSTTVLLDSIEIAVYLTRGLAASIKHLMIKVVCLKKIICQNK